MFFSDCIPKHLCSLLPSMQKTVYLRSSILTELVPLRTHTYLMLVLAYNLLADEVQLGLWVIRLDNSGE